jgi:hypothetical protein
MALAQEPDLAGADILDSADLRSIRRRLHEDFSDLPASTVDRCLEVEALRFEGCRIASFVPILVDRNTRAWLREVRATGH